MSDKKHYKKRDLEDLGQYYLDHVQAMTAEELNSKSDIAAELAQRDYWLQLARDKYSELLSRVALECTRDQLRNILLPECGDVKKVPVPTPSVIHWEDCPSRKGAPVCDCKQRFA